MVEGPPAVPRQLPAAVPAFTGRAQELATLCDTLSGGQSGSLVVCAVVGVGGIGKSSLALHAAHALVDRFPDGQLYIDLQGAAAGVAPLAPLEVLGRFLRALGVPTGDVPMGVEEAAARFRTEVADRRLLLVLDNAADAAQVRHLLPGTAGCAVVVTSRRVLSSLIGVAHLHLDVFSERESVELLIRLVGAARVAAEAGATAEVARWCGHLPLALRIAGARLTARPSWPIAHLSDRLAAAHRRLDELRLAGEIDVRASLDLSYREMADSGDPVERAAAAAFPRLGLWDGPDVDLSVAARLLDRGEEAAEPVLERLVDVGLLETHAPGRYRLHDLVRLYARDTAGRLLTAVERTAAVGRALRFYTATAWRTTALLLPGNRRLKRIDEGWAVGGRQFADAAEALAWLEAERANLVAVVGQAADDDRLAAGALQLSDALFGFFRVRGHAHDWERVNQTALRVADRRGDRTAQAQILNDFGVVRMVRGAYEDALDCLRRSAAASAGRGDEAGRAATLANLGIVARKLCRYQEAADYLTESLAISRRFGDAAGEATSLVNVGDVYLRLGRPADAVAHLRQGLELSQHLGDRSAEAVSLINLGEAYAAQGRHTEAVEYLRRSLAIHEKLGAGRGQAQALLSLGEIHRAEGRFVEALDCYERSRALCQQLGHRHEEADAAHGAGTVLLALGDAERGRSRLDTAAVIYAQLGLDRRLYQPDDAELPMD